MYFLFYLHFTVLLQYCYSYVITPTSTLVLVLSTDLKIPELQWSEVTAIIHLMAGHRECLYGPHKFLERRALHSLLLFMMVQNEYHMGLSHYKIRRDYQNKESNKYSTLLFFAEANHFEYFTSFATSISYKKNLLI